MNKKNINILKSIYPIWMGWLFFFILSACADKNKLDKETTGREIILNDFSHFNFQNILDPSTGGITPKPPFPGEEWEATVNPTDPTWLISLLVNPEIEKDKVNCTKRAEVLAALGLELYTPSPQESPLFTYKGWRCAFGNAADCPLTSIRSIGLYLTSYQHFREIPPHIRCLEGLEYISIVDFSAGSWGLNEFISPEVLAHLQKVKLKGLRIEGNKFNAFPLSLFELNSLEILDISNNPISEIPNNIDRLSNLTHLYLNGLSLSNLNGLSNSGLKLKYLSISENKKYLNIQPSDGTIETDSLILKNSKINQFSSAFEQMPVKYLDLSGNQIEEIPDVLNFNDSPLEEIYLDGLTAFPYNLLLTAKKLEILDLSNGKITNLSEDLVITSGLDPTFKCQVLKSINLSNNEIDNIHWSIGACAKKLDLQKNNINNINDLLYFSNNNNNINTGQASINLQNNKINGINLSSYSDNPKSVWRIVDLKNNPLTFNTLNWTKLSALSLIKIKISKTQFDATVQNSMINLLGTLIEFE